MQPTINNFRGFYRSRGNHSIQLNSLQNATKEIATETLPLNEPFMLTFVTQRHQLTRAIIMHIRMHHRGFLNKLRRISISEVMHG